MKEIKNRIHRVKEDAIVLGETLCALEESRDIPVDMVYALLVDFHRDLNNATPLINFVGETNQSFAPGTVAMAYFENHDSIRASRVWRERYGGLLEDDPGLAAFWTEMTGTAKPEVWMAQLKNLQASVINASIGDGAGIRTIYGTEWGTEMRTDFENATIVPEDRLGEPPSIYLEQAYASLSQLVRSSPALAEGELFFHRPSDIGDSEDKLLAYSRSLMGEKMLFLHTLDHQWRRTAKIDMDTVSASNLSCIYDTYAFSIYSSAALWETLSDGSTQIHLGPLQSVVLKSLE